MQDNLTEKSQDYTESIVPQSERRSALSMGLLWITMAVGFPCVMAGFEWYRAGFSLQQVLIGSAIGCMILAFYATCSAWLGASTGQTWGLLVRRVFGSTGAKLVSFNYIWIFIGFYALSAVLLAQGINGIFHTAIPTVYLAAILAVLMSFNNIFGFSGVVNFARFIVAPVLIVWVLLTITKVIAISPAAVWIPNGKQSFIQAITVVVSYILGLGVWGNEPDYWRFAKARMPAIVTSLGLAIAIGFFIFPTAGWLLANLYGITNNDAAMNVLGSFLFGPAIASPIIGMLMILSYFALNDANLYGTITILENIIHIDRRKIVFISTVVSTLLTIVLVNLTNALEVIASINGVLAAVPTVILCIEFLVLSKIQNAKDDFNFVAKEGDVRKYGVPALIALTCAYVVGILTSGIIPGTAAWRMGISPIQASVVSAVIYFFLRISKFNKPTDFNLLSAYKDKNRDKVFSPRS